MHINLFAISLYSNYKPNYYPNHKKIKVMKTAKKVDNLKKVVVVNKIESTLDYMKFKTLNENRPLDEGHIKRLQTSFQTFGTSLCRMVVVKTKSLSTDGKLEYYCIDGNHTRNALHRMGLPIDIVIVELLEDTRLNLVQAMAVLNNSNKAWSPDNYLNSYAKLDIYEYRKMRAIKLDTGLTISDLQRIFLGRGKEQDFKSGLAVFIDENNSQRLLDATMKIKLHVPNKAFTRRAFYKLCENTCDYDKFADAIIRTSKNLKKAYSSFSENESVFENQLLTIYKKTFNKK